MELKAFVTETLLQIIQGVKEAQDKAQELGAVINPASITVGEGILSTKIKDKTRLVQIVEFQVGLTISNEENSKAGLGVMLGSLGIGVNSSTTGNTSTATSIKFNVPVALPSVNNENTSSGLKVKPFKTT